MTHEKIGLNTITSGNITTLTNQRIVNSNIEDATITESKFAQAVQAKLNTVGSGGGDSSNYQIIQNDRISSNSRNPTQLLTKVPEGGLESSNRDGTEREILLTKKRIIVFTKESENKYLTLPNDIDFDENDAYSLDIATDCDGVVGRPLYVDSATGDSLCFHSDQSSSHFASRIIIQSDDRNNPNGYHFVKQTSSQWQATPFYIGQAAPPTIPFYNGYNFQPLPLKVTTTNQGLRVNSSSIIEGDNFHLAINARFNYEYNIISDGNSRSFRLYHVPHTNGTTTDSTQPLVTQWNDFNGVECYVRGDISGTIPALNSEENPSGGFLVNLPANSVLKFYKIENRTVNNSSTGLLLAKIT